MGAGQLTQGERKMKVDGKVHYDKISRKLGNPGAMILIKCLHCNNRVISPLYKVALLRWSYIIFILRQFHFLDH